MKLFLFTSSVLNEERNAALFESVLTTQHSLQLQDDPLAEASLLGGVPPADYILELADCEAFIAAHESETKGWLTPDELAIALAPHALTSIKSPTIGGGTLSDDHMSSLNMTGDISIAHNASDGAADQESIISALLAHIVTSEALFLTKIQNPMVR